MSLKISNQHAKRPARDTRSTRERLLAAARDVFNTVGYYSTDTNRIARAAGFAPATFYKHFEDKQDIFLAVYREWVLAEWEGLRAVAQEDSATNDFARKSLTLILEHHRRWAGFRKNLRALSLMDTAVWDARMTLREAQLGFMSDMLRTLGVETIPQEKLLFLQFTVERMCDAIADEETRALKVSDESVFDELEMFLTSFLHPSS